MCTAKIEKKEMCMSGARFLLRLHFTCTLFLSKFLFGFVFFFCNLFIVPLCFHVEE